MPEIASQIDRFLEELTRRNASAHTLRNYGSDLRQFCDYFAIDGKPQPNVEDIDVLAIREWLGDLYQQSLTAVPQRSSNVRSRRATWPSSNCSTVADCASASWSASISAISISASAGFE